MTRNEFLQSVAVAAILSRLRQGSRRALLNGGHQARLFEVRGSAAEKHKIALAMENHKGLLGRVFGSALGGIRPRLGPAELLQVERENVRMCMKYASEKKLIA